MTPSPVLMDHWLVKVKFALKDALEIGRGRWTLWLHMIKNKKFIKAIIEHSMRLQADLENLKQGNINRQTTNTQCLWSEFKINTQKIAKKHIKATHYRINSWTTHLEKDQAELANHPNADMDIEIHISKDIIVKELEYLEKKGL